MPIQTRTRAASNPWPEANPSSGKLIVSVAQGRFECNICRAQEHCVHMQKFFEDKAESNYFPTFPPEETILYMPLAKGHSWIPVKVKMESGEIFGDVRSKNYLTAIVSERSASMSVGRGKKFELSIDPEEGLSPVVRAIESYYGGGGHNKHYEFMAERINGQHLIPRSQRNIIPCPGLNNHKGFKSEELFQRRYNANNVGVHEIVVAEVASIAINGCCAQCFIALNLQGRADSDW